MSIAFNVSLSLPYSTVARMLIDACERSSDAWLLRVDVDIDGPSTPIPGAAERDRIVGGTHRRGWPLYAVAPFIDGMSLVVQARDDGDGGAATHYVTRSMFVQAVQLLATKHPQIFGEALGGTWIGEHADALLQLAVFGKVRFN